MAGRFQSAYLALVERAAQMTRRSVPRVLIELAERSAVRNRFDRITGDAVVYAADLLTRRRRALGPDGVWAVLDRFVRHQTLDPDRCVPGSMPRLHRSARRAFDEILGILAECRHGL